MRIILAAGFLLVGVCGAAPALAQSPWTFEGVAFPEQAGWCPKTAQQDDGSGGKVSALEVRPCGKALPFLSVTLGVRGAAPQNIASFTAKAADISAGPDGMTTVDNLFKAKSPSCARLTYSMDRNPVSGLAAFLVHATYSCPALSADAYQFNNLTTYAQQRNGNLWVVAYDQDSPTLTEMDKAMIRSAVAAIATN